MLNTSAGRIVPRFIQNRAPKPRKKLGDKKIVDALYTFFQKAADLAALEQMVSSVLDHIQKPRGYHRSLPEEAEHPSSTPIFWITKWIDYSNKYGIGMFFLSNR